MEMMVPKIYVYESAAAPGMWWAGVSYGSEHDEPAPTPDVRIIVLEQSGDSRREALESMADTLRWLSDTAAEKARKGYP
jgi:hypothetical protein